MKVQVIVFAIPKNNKENQTRRKEVAEKTLKIFVAPVTVYSRTEQVDELNKRRPVKLSLKQAAEMRTIVKWVKKTDKIQNRIVSLSKPYIHASF